MITEGCMIIRYMRKDDKPEVLKMMKVFYNSPAIIHHASEDVLIHDIDCCLSDMPFVEGYVFDVDGQIAGYSMVAKGFSTEYGGICLFIEDLYIKPEYRGRRFGESFFKFIEDKYSSSAVRLRLEAEKSNDGAIRLYKRCGLNESQYLHMVKEF